MEARALETEQYPPEQYPPLVIFVADTVPASFGRNGHSVGTNPRIA